MLLSRLSTGEKSKRHQSTLQKQVLHHRLDVCRIVEVPVEWIGFSIPDEFVVGYGLDYAQRYRNLPFIGVVEPGAGEE